MVLWVESQRLLTQVLQIFLPLEQVIDNDRQLIAIEKDLFELLQVFELFLVEIFELEVNRKREDYVSVVRRWFRLINFASCRDFLSARGWVQ